MKYCSKCGNALSEGARFCRSCGEPTNSNAPVDVTASNVAPSQTPSSTAPLDDENLGGKSPAIQLSTLVLGGVLACLIGGGAYLISTTTNRGTNLAQNKTTDVASPANSTESGSVINSLDEERSKNCQSNLKQIALGFVQYTQDYDEKFPVISSGDANDGSEAANGWAHNIQPYLKSTQIFNCPSEENPPFTDASQIGYTDYYYNLMLAGKNQAAIDVLSNTILNGDGISSNSLYNRTERETQGEPGADVRHLGGANYAFADGHVKWLRPEKVEPSSVPPDGSNITFGIALPAKAVDSAPVESVYVGERFPETRLRYLDSAEIESWSYAKVRYALNEIFARHGYSFRAGPIRKQFQQFSWYAPVAGRSQEEIEQDLGLIEKSNLLLLSQRRNDLQNSE